MLAHYDLFDRFSPGWGAQRATPDGHRRCEVAGQRTLGVPRRPVAGDFRAPEERSGIVG